MTDFDFSKAKHNNDRVYCHDSDFQCCETFIYILRPKYQENVSNLRAPTVAETIFGGKNNGNDVILMMSQYSTFIMTSSK